MLKESLNKKIYKEIISYNIIMSEELIDVNIENIQIVRKVNPHNEKTVWRSQGEKYDCRQTNYKE